MSGNTPIWRLCERTKALLAQQYRTLRWFLRRPRLPCRRGGVVNLHLGCGSIAHPAFVNIDLRPYPHVHYLRPIDDLSNFADHTVDLIYASHCLEHFPFRRVPEVLAEWARVLKEGGTLRVSVPNFDSLVEIYRASGNNMDIIQQVIVGGQDYEHNFHYVVFNEAYLSKLLRQAGFSEIQEWTPDSSEMTTFGDFSGLAYRVDDTEFKISLNLEARRVILPRLLGHPAKRI